VITLPELVALLYQADWKRLSLLARMSWARDREADRQFRQRSEPDLQRRTWTAVTRLTGMPGPAEPSPGELEQECRVLLAPGGRFRVEAVADGTVAAVGDGERRWALIADRALRRPGEGPGAALHGLVTPQWLLARYDLRVAGPAEVAGRPAHQVTGTPRRVSRQLADNFDRLDRADVLVDAALGIILRSELVFGGRVLERAQLHDLEFDPPEAAGAALFALPSHARDLDRADDSDDSEPGGRGWQAAGAAAGAAASAMGFAARHYPRQAARRTPGDTEPVMPADARRGPVPAADRTPAGADLANLLHRTGRPPPAFTAELHRWQDDDVCTDILQGFRGALPPWLDGILGPDALWDALAEHGPGDHSEHQTARLRVALPGRYRIDYRTGNWHVRYAALACDGTRTRGRDRLRGPAVRPGPAPAGPGRGSGGRRRGPRRGGRRSRRHRLAGPAPVAAAPGRVAGRFRSPGDPGADIRISDAVKRGQVIGMNAAREQDLISLVGGLAVLPIRAQPLPRAGEPSRRGNNAGVSDVLRVTRRRRPGGTGRDAGGLRPGHGGRGLRCGRRAGRHRHRRGGR
jgi:hypothetical protein